MQGIVTDVEGRYVKAAIVKLYKAQDSSMDSEIEQITYALTDDEGNFMIQDMDPDEKYIIEVHLENKPKIQEESNNNLNNHKSERGYDNNSGECVLREVYTGNMMNLDKDVEDKLYASRNITWW